MWMHGLDGLGGTNNNNEMGSDCVFDHTGETTDSEMEMLQVTKVKLARQMLNSSIRRNHVI